MALFWSKKPKAETNYGEETRKAKTVSAKTVKSDKKPVKAEVIKKDSAVKTPSMSPSAFSDATSAIIHPHITEKSGLLSQNGVYTFKVSSDSNKNTVAQAVSKLYKVNPVKVAIVNLPSKNVIVKGRRGVVSGTRKAMVTLKKGDKIDFV